MTNMFFSSLAVAGLLVASPVATQTGSAVVNEKSVALQLIVVTPIVMDHIVFIVCDAGMDDIWIYLNGGQLVAEAHGDLGTRHEFDFSKQASGLYTVIVHSGSATDSSQFFYN